MSKLSEKLLVAGDDKRVEYLDVFNDYVSAFFESAVSILKLIENAVSKTVISGDEMNLRKEFLELAAKTSLGTVLTVLVTVLNQIQDGQTADLNIKLIAGLAAQCCK